MDYRTERIFLGFVVFLAVINLGSSLECITCNATKQQQNNCQTLQSKATCPSNSVCLSSTYRVSTAGVSKTYITKSCYMKNGQECKTFLKNQEVQHGGSLVKEIHCYVCEENDCNLSDSGASSMSSMSLVFGLFNLLLVKSLV